MPNPMRKHSNARTGSRRANWKLKHPAITTCPQCAEKIRPHRICGYCGYYRGRQVVVIRPKKKEEARKGATAS